MGKELPMLSRSRLGCLLFGVFCFVGSLVVAHLLDDGFKIAPAPPAGAFFRVRLNKLASSTPEYPHCTAVVLDVQNISDKPHSLYRKDTFPGFTLVDSKQHEHEVRVAEGFPAPSGPLDPVPPDQTVRLRLLFDELHEPWASSLDLVSHSWQLPSRLTITAKQPLALYALLSYPPLLPIAAIASVFMLLIGCWPDRPLRRFCVALLALIALYSVLYLAAVSVIPLPLGLLASPLLASVVLAHGRRAGHKLPFDYPTGFTGTLGAEWVGRLVAVPVVVSYSIFLSWIMLSSAPLTSAANISIMRFAFASDMPHLSNYLLLLLSAAAALYLTPPSWVKGLIGAIVISLSVSTVILLLALGPALTSGTFWIESGVLLGYKLFFSVSLIAILVYVGKT
ncbi:MAG: hypothetical protein Q8Q12_07395 [bacterium]|nr:hypothetical protein [bacterium]